MTHKVGLKGQIVIPQELREALGLEPGDEVSFWMEGDHVAVRPVRNRPPLRGRFRGHDLIGDLLAERAADRTREENQAAG
jgi:AbrB family looped-hinge helix DNA binding protein